MLGVLGACCLMVQDNSCRCESHFGEVTHTGLQKFKDWTYSQILQSSLTVTTQLDLLVSLHHECGAQVVREG